MQMKIIIIITIINVIILLHHVTRNSTLKYMRFYQLFQAYFTEFLFF